MSKIVFTIKELYTTWNKVITALARHWAIKAALFSNWEKLTMVAINDFKRNNPDVKFPLQYKVNITIIAGRKDKRLSDSDGLSMKPIIDALVHNGVIINDDYRYVGYTSSLVYHKGENEVKIILEEFKGI